MTYFLENDSSELVLANNFIRDKEYQKAINVYRVEMTKRLEHGKYLDFIKLAQSLADSYYLNKDFEKASHCYFAIVAYNIWQYPDIIYDYVMSNRDFNNFILSWGTHLGYTLYGWDSEYVNYISWNLNRPLKINNICTDIGTNRLLLIFKKLKQDSQIQRNDLPEDKPISAREYYLFDKNICQKVGKELFEHVVFEQLDFYKPSY